MKFISTIKRNKRGQEYTTRPTRNANGFSKQYGKNKHNGRTKVVHKSLLKLHVYGTFDTLAKTRFDMIWITVEHPVDKAYTKRVKILVKNKKKFINRIPLA